MDARDAPVITSGGGLTLHLFAALPVQPHVARSLAAYGELLATRSPSSRAVEAADMHLMIADFGPVAEEFVPAIAQALDLAARHVPGATSCTVVGSPVLDNGATRGAAIDLDLHVLLGAMRDELLTSSAPYAPFRDRRAWMPHVTVLRAPVGDTLSDAARDTLLQPDPGAWIAPQVELLALISGPLGHHYRRLHVASFGDTRVAADH